MVDCSTLAKEQKMSIVSPSLRKEYTQSKLLETDLESNPFSQFRKWFDEAVSTGLPLPNAMTLSTVKKDHSPAARIVLLKELDDRGFIFFTNYQSAKSDELAHQSKASLLFWWISQERQVRIEGVTEKISASESEEYFATRPRDSQLSAWASNQSHPVSGRPELEKKMAEMKTKFADQKVTKPNEWGGYRLLPDFFEYWQGREDRLHDRICYFFEKNSWKVQRLAP